MSNAPVHSGQSRGFHSVISVVELARVKSNQRLRNAAAEGTLSRRSYVRFLTSEYYLTRGVQRSLLHVVASDRLARKRKLREFLTTCWRFGTSRLSVKGCPTCL